MAKAKAKKAAANLSAIIREGLAIIGLDKTAAAGWEWYKETYGELAKEENKATFASTWAGQRKKLTGGTTTTASKPAKATTRASKPTAPTSSGLANLTPDQLAQRLEDAAQVIRAFGGMK